MNKKHFYKTALWHGEYVTLLKYFESGDYYHVKTAAGDIYGIPHNEMSGFCL